MWHIRPGPRGACGIYGRCQKSTSILLCRHLSTRPCATTRSRPCADSAIARAKPSPPAATAAGQSSGRGGGRSSGNYRARRPRNRPPVRWPGRVLRQGRARKPHGRASYGLPETLPRIGNIAVSQANAAFSPKHPITLIRHDGRAAADLDLFQHSFECFQPVGLARRLVPA